VAGRYLLAPFSELPPLQEDQVYLHDLIGMKAVSATGEKPRHCDDVLRAAKNHARHQHSRGSVLIPYRLKIIVRTDIDARTILINDTLASWTLWAARSSAC